MTPSLRVLGSPSPKNILIHVRSFGDAQGIIDTLEETKTLGVVNRGMELGARSLEPKGKEGPKSYKGIDGMYDRVRRSHCSHVHYPPT